MLFFDVQNEGEFGMKILERPIAFVAFRHKIFAAWVPVRVGPENRDFRANVMRRMKSTFAQNVRGHCRGRRFSVLSSDDDAALAVHDGSERLGPAPDRLSRIARA